jgi:hypothetical protein
MTKQASHTETSAAGSLRLVPEIGLVDVTDPGLPERLAGKVSEQLEAFAAQMRQGLLAASVTIGLEVMGELIDAEVTEVAGPKGRHDPGRAAYRHGSEAGRVTLGGRRIPVRRPRVRTVADEAGVEREVHLEAYDTFASVDLLADHMVASMLAGLSGRRYERALEPVGDAVDAAATGTSQSAVSRRFVTATKERLGEFRARPLDDQRWLICFVDGFDFEGHTMVGALGVTADGTKVPLGVVEAPPRTRQSCAVSSPACATGAWTSVRVCCSCSTAARRSPGRCATCSATTPSSRDAGSIMPSSGLCRLGLGMPCGARTSR